MTSTTDAPESEVHASLYAETQTAMLEHLLSALDVEPSSTERLGDEIPGGRPGRRYRFTSWELRAPAAADDDHFGVGTLSAWIESFDDDFARRLASLGPDVRVGLNIVQTVDALDDIDTQNRAQNFWLTPRALRWLAAAGAELGIDQYFLYPSPEVPSEE